MQKSLVLYENLNSVSGKIKVLNNLGITYKEMGMYSKALKNYNASLKLSQKTGDTRSEVGTFSNIGIVYQHIGNYSDALNNYFNSLEITQQLGDIKWESKTFNNIAIVYQEIGEYKNALVYYNKSAELYRKIDDKFSEVLVLKNIGEVFEKQGNYEKALDYLQKSLPIIVESGNEETLSQIYNDIADVYCKMGSFDESINYNKKCLRIAIKNGYKQCQAVALFSIGSALIFQKKYNKAIDKFYESLEIAKEKGIQKLEYQNYELLSTAYEKLGNFKSSLKYSRSFFVAKEKILNEESDRTRQKIIANYEAKAAKNETEKYKLKNVEFAKSIDERKALMRIAAHDLRNPIFKIREKSLLKKEHQENNEKLTNRLNQINKLSLQTSQILEKFLSLETIEFGKIFIKQEKIDLGKFVFDMVESSRSLATEKSISIYYNHPAEELFIYSDKIVLREIFDNLISNAVKYSPLGKNIFVTVSNFKKNIRCEIKDEGPGLTTEDKQKLFGKFCKLSAKPTGDESSTGLGLSIVKKLIEKVGGRVWCESEVDKGANFIFELPQYFGKN
jgi:signal transduction histidine kinase/Flp pilus assembly protein TadD